VSSLDAAGHSRNSTISAQQTHGRTRTPAVQAPCLFRQMSAYVLQATKLACLFSLDTKGRHTAQRATYISCNRPVRLKAWLRLLGKFNVYTCQQIIIFHCRFTSLLPHGRQIAFPSSTK